MWQSILAFINSIPPEAWQVLVVAFIASPAGAWIKHQIEKRGREVRGWVMFIGVASVSFGSAWAAYMLKNPDYTPWFIAIQGAVTYFTTQPYYFGVVKPIGSWLAGIAKNSAEFDEQVKSAAVPLGGVPLELSTEPPKPGPDFSN